MPTKTNRPGVVLKKTPLLPKRNEHRNQPVQKLKVSNAGNDQNFLVQTLLDMACPGAGTNVRPPAHRSCSNAHRTLCRVSRGRNTNHAALVCTAPGCNFSGHQQETDKLGRRQPVHGTAGKEKKKPLSSVHVGAGRNCGDGQRLALAVHCLPAPLPLPVRLNPRRGKQTRKYSRGHGRVVDGGILSTLAVAVLMCMWWGLGGVEAFAKLPNGDPSSSSTGTAGTLRRAVSDWIKGGASRSTVVATYGPIENWDVSEVTNMKFVFYNFKSFNKDLSKWNTAVVTSMNSSKCAHLSLSAATPSAVVYFEYTTTRVSHRITLLTRFVLFVFVCLKRYSFLLFVVGWSFLFLVSPSLLCLCF